MSIIHPIQNFVISDDGKNLFLVIKNVLLAYRIINDEYKLVGKWVDNYCQEKQNEDVRKKAKNNNGDAVVTKSKKQQEVTAAEALSLNSNIRSLKIFDANTKLAMCADSDKSVTILNVDLNAQENCLSVYKREPFSKRPNAITITDDGKNILMADKFGDVFDVDVTTKEVDTSEERKPILGHVSMLTDILFKRNEQGKQFVITTDRDEHIKISHFPQSFVVDKWLFGHKEFISSISPLKWNNQWLLSAGGDESVFLWNWESGKLLSQFSYTDLVKPFLNEKHLAASRFQNENNDLIEYTVAKIAASSTKSYAAFFVEATKALFIIKMDTSTGEMALQQIIETPANIISLMENNNKFYVTLDNRNEQNKNFIKVVSFDPEQNKFTIDEDVSNKLDSALSSNLKNDNDVTVNVDDVYDLYNVITLKKHGEHFS